MRIFLAIRFTDEMKRGLTGAMEALYGRGVRGSFTDPRNLHLTLAFIGETDRLRDIHDAVREVEFEPFEITAGKIGRFGDLLWRGVDGGDELPALAARLREALKRRGIPFDEKPFRAHITLVRRSNVTALPDIGLPAARMIAARASVMKSERLRGELIYTEV